MMYNLKNEIYLLPSHPIVLPGLEKSLIEGNYPSKKEIEELCRNYRIAIKKEEEKISDNENCIKKFITTYGLLYVDVPGREYRRKLREIEEEILCQILTEEERDGKEKIFQTCYFSYSAHTPDRPPVSPASDVLYPSVLKCWSFRAGTALYLLMEFAS